MSHCIVMNAIVAILVTHGDWVFSPENHHIFDMVVLTPWKRWLLPISRPARTCGLDARLLTKET
jgi:hypothetical protein